MRLLTRLGLLATRRLLPALWLLRALWLLATLRLLAACRRLLLGFSLPRLLLSLRLLGRRRTALSRCGGWCRLRRASPHHDAAIHDSRWRR